ncbi:MULTISPECIES: Flp pilus assembly protein CpaB [Asticcacaulis]|uniref:Flp pilus assembly protein CpaB n=1 Tax=Asticcacaulis TaxID=76890 RepID=UPI001AEA4393|nr:MULTISPECIES: Flp pilus assembly protein CpaB [Asticcacaulis]MBP2159735.1 pilus assembly protein CpaB [Asticcacaulis solisilvae]MDR6800780.1 pilus assembly protein CpaB [Asticcacaulis sp. BE141]
MKTSRYVVLGIAAVAGILLFFLVRGMIGGKATTEATATPAPAPAPVASAHVLVASRNIKAGEHIAEADLRWQDWPANMVTPAYITDQPIAPTPEPAANTAPANGSEDAAAKAQQTGNDIAAAAKRTLGPNARTALVGAVAREDILANEPIIEAKIVRADQGGFMAVMLAPGMRAVAVPVSVDNTAGGFILPGDRVDILVTHQTPRAGGSGTVDSVQPVLRNIRVLAIDQQVNTEDKQNLIGATATLEVSPVDGQALVLAKASGTLSLMLRSYADAAGPSGIVTAIPTGGDGSVRVFRNGQSSDVLVTR